MYMYMYMYMVYMYCSYNVIGFEKRAHLEQNVDFYLVTLH